MCLLYTADQTCRGSFQRQEFWRNRVRRAMRLVSYRTDATHNLAYNIYGYRNLFTLVLTTSLSHVFNDVVHVHLFTFAIGCQRCCFVLQRRIAAMRASLSGTARNSARQLIGPDTKQNARISQRKAIRACRRQALAITSTKLHGSY